MLTLAVFMWSLSTFITPFFAQSMYALMFLRVLLGIGEGLGRFTTFSLTKAQMLVICQFLISSEI